MNKSESGFSLLNKQLCTGEATMVYCVHAAAGYFIVPRHKLNTGTPWIG